MPHECPHLMRQEHGYFANVRDFDLNRGNFEVELPTHHAIEVPFDILWPLAKTATLGDADNVGSSLAVSDAAHGLGVDGAQRASLSHIRVYEHTLFFRLTHGHARIYIYIYIYICVRVRLSRNRADQLAAQVGARRAPKPRRAPPGPELGELVFADLLDHVACS